MGLLPAASLVMHGDRLVLLLIHRLELRRGRRNSILMLIWHKFRVHSEEKEEKWIVEETVDGAKYPERDEKVEEVLDDELEGREVKNEEDENGGCDAVKDVGNGVLQG